MSGIDLLISAFAKQQISAFPNHVLLECDDFAMTTCVLVFVIYSEIPEKSQQFVGNAHSIWCFLCFALSNKDL